MELYHRDINPENPMYYRDAQGRAVGVLNDFNRSPVAYCDSQRPRERIGSPPFMANDLLPEEKLQPYGVCFTPDMTLRES